MTKRVILEGNEYTATIDGEAAANKVKSRLGAATNKVGEAYEYAKSVVHHAYTQNAERAQESWASVTQDANRAFSPQQKMAEFRTTAHHLAQDIADKAQQGANSVKDATDTANLQSEHIIDRVKNYFASMWQSTRDNVQAAEENVAERAESVRDAMFHKAAKGADKAREAGPNIIGQFKNAKDSISHQLEKSKDESQSAFHEYYNQVRRKFNEADESYWAAVRKLEEAKGRGAVQDNSYYWFGQRPRYETRYEQAVEKAKQVRDKASKELNSAWEAVKDKFGISLEKPFGKGTFPPERNYWFYDSEYDESLTGGPHGLQENAEYLAHQASIAVGNWVQNFRRDMDHTLKEGHEHWVRTTSKLHTKFVDISDRLEADWKAVRDQTSHGPITQLREIDWVARDTGNQLRGLTREAGSRFDKTARSLSSQWKKAVKHAGDKRNEYQKYYENMVEDARKQYYKSIENSHNAWEQAIGEARNHYAEVVRLIEEYSKLPKEDAAKSKKEVESKVKAALAAARKAEHEAHKKAQKDVSLVGKQLGVLWDNVTRQVNLSSSALMGKASDGLDKMIELGQRAYDRIPGVPTITGLPGGLTEQPQAPLVSMIYGPLLALWFVLLARRVWIQRKKTGVWYGDGTYETAKSLNEVTDGVRPTEVLTTATTRKRTRKVNAADEITHAQDDRHVSPQQPTPDYSGLTRAISELSHFATTVPFTLLLLLALEVNGAARPIVHVLYLGLITSQVFLSQDLGTLFGFSWATRRDVGAYMQWIVTGIAAVCCFLVTNYGSTLLGKLHI
ncbi:uncharacterized protein VTP21DRAFT_4364 [Calcarisporiella thermophila]|uniref:uncharacterized protein n=1 Tax=Calcarisporiella thermophila TaxID=911321 RepID=UPI0037443F47